jgi:Zn-dependent M28 family amino/carboxypeptidase
MINLEAAGTTGGALLFQATSKEMVEAFAHAPRSAMACVAVVLAEFTSSPRGSVIAADVFASGVLMSDTDFGQFEQYLNVSGLDVSAHS